MSLSRLKPSLRLISPSYRTPACVIRQSSSAPTYSSTGSTSDICTTLKLPRIASMILQGNPNRPFPAEFNVDVDEMTEGGKQALGVVTEIMESGELARLEGLVSPDCSKGLEEQLGQMSEEEKKFVHVNPDDIFFSFIPDFKDSKSGQTLLLVTFSFPQLSKIKEMMLENQAVKEANIAEIKSIAQDKTLEKGEIAAAIKESHLLAVQTLKEPQTIFEANEILIGNFRFERPDRDSEWTIVSVGQMNSVVAWHWIFQKRWKGRLGIALRGFDFYKVLRFDYMTDWFAYTLFASFFLSGLGVGTVSPPPS